MQSASPPAVRSLLYAVAVILAIGVLPLPYAYYALLRVLGSIAFAYIAWVALSTRSWATLLIALLALFTLNPVVPLRLPKDLWASIDAAAAAYLAIVAKHVQTKFTTYAPPERTVEALAKMLGFAVLLALFGAVALVVLAGLVVIPLKWLGFGTTGNFLNPLAYAAASAVAVAVLSGYAYHSGTRASSRIEV